VLLRATVGGRITPSACSHSRNSIGKGIERAFRVHCRNKGAQTWTWQARMAAAAAAAGGEEAGLKGGVSAVMAI
jgi:hypothetical protein